MQNINELKALLGTPQKVLITTHHKPDADALGSSLAMQMYLEKLGHQVIVVTPTDYPAFLFWMKGNDRVILFDGNEERCKEIVANSTLIFCLDFNALTRINDLGILIKNAKGKKVLIDHHLEPEHFADISFSDITASATAQLIYEIIDALGDKNKIDIPIGECIYAGIMTDTGSFRHSSTTANVHLIAAELKKIGVDTTKIHQLIYDNNSEIRLRFLGFALAEKLVVLPKYFTAYILLNGEELNRFETKTGDTEGLVNFALSIKDIHLAVIIIERQDGIKMSFRSTGDFSVNEFARKHFEGGGHKNAAGGKSNLTLLETEQKLLTLLPEYINQLSHSN